MNQIEGSRYRITVLTDRLLRLEYQAEGKFEDRKTQIVMNRDFPACACTTWKENGRVFLETDALKLSYDEQPFSSTGLSIYVKALDTVWNYSVIYGNSDRNLMGTARTLDMTDGFLMLEPGLFGHNGYAVVDDSLSAVYEDDAFLPREHAEQDLYFFGYGKDFYAGLRDFYHLCGKAPMIPRYALGNWWSRYYKYTEDSYLALLDRFEEEQIPLSVAVIDMDWHVTEVDPKYGTGWTGYTWNTDFFPDYRRFLKALKDRNLKTTLNLHPADGIRAFEAMYPRMAARMGVDPASEKAIEFDFADPQFREAYFEEVLHPYEKDGVDFWWIDWQQGTGKSGEVDPLLLLNHYHYHDQEGRGIRPMIFSRYAGVGSHRYPLGFSGDTLTTWRSLAFQPFFTSTASNIGYGWWSHDIGGHMLGDKDNERLIRWIQLGVFSPIMRIHSSASPFFNKEPWTLDEPYRQIMGDFLRLRHRLLPYLYTMAHEAYANDRPLVQPMYYLLPEDPNAYDVRGEYGFGSELIVSSITQPMDPSLRLAAANTLIPEGRWYDLMTGRIYRGGKRRKLYRRLSDYPVLMKAGGIVPESLEDQENGTNNPSAMRVLIGTGACGSFTMYEDDGITMDYQKGMAVQTTFRLEEEKGEIRFTVDPTRGTLALIPAARTYELWFYGIRPTENAAVGTGSWTYDPEKNIVKVQLAAASVQEGVRVVLQGFAPAANDHRQQVFRILDEAWIENMTKDRVYWSMMRTGDPVVFVKDILPTLDIDETLKDAIREVFEDQ